MHKIKLEDVMSNINKVLNSQSKTVEILTLIEPIIRSFDGKKITKRICTALEKEFPNLKFRYGKSYSWYELIVRGDDGIELKLNLSYLGQGDIFSFNEYVRLNQCYYLDKERYDVLSKQVDNKEEIAALVAGYNEIFDKIQELKKRIPDIYPIKSSFLF